jgi:hypothetical protein
MFAPGQRIIHPTFGDVTADVIEELVAMGRPQDPVIIEREQAEIAAVAGQVATHMSCGRMVAQVHGDSFDYWTKREGLGFWKDKKNLAKFLRDNPGAKVHSISANPTVSFAGCKGVTGKRGRWALKTA